MTFTAALEKMDHDGGWHFVRLSAENLITLRQEADGKKGNVPVLCRIGKSEWASTIMSMGEQQWFVAVKAGVRQAEKLQQGDNLSITISPDQSRLKNKEKTA